MVCQQRCVPVCGSLGVRELGVGWVGAVSVNGYTCCCWNDDMILRIILNSRAFFFVPRRPQRRLDRPRQRRHRLIKSQARLCDRNGTPERTHATLCWCCGICASICTVDGSPIEDLRTVFFARRRPDVAAFGRPQFQQFPEFGTVACVFSLFGAWSNYSGGCVGSLGINR